MKVEVIPNRGLASMGPEIEQSLLWAEQVSIASAFVTTKALSRLESALSESQKKQRPLTIRLLFGLYQRFTPPTALKRMLDLQRDYPGKLYVRVARNNRFHWKLYIFKNGNSRRFYVGSANLTEDALTASGELSLRLTTKALDAISKSLEIEFDTLWQGGSFPLSRDLWQKYKAVKRHVIVAPHKDDKVSGLLEKAERIPVSPSSSAHPKPRVVFIDDNLRPETEEIIRSDTNWNSENWDYMCNGKWWHDLIVKVSIAARCVPPVTAWCVPPMCTGTGPLDRPVADQRRGVADSIKRMTMGRRQG